jgi:hypothetical protein
VAKKVDEFQFPEGTFPTRKKSVAQFLWTLYLDGPFEDHQSGLATTLFKEALRKRGCRLPDSVVTILIKQFSNDDNSVYPYVYLGREVKGKRTYRLWCNVTDPYAVPFPPSPFNLRDKVDYQPGADKTDYRPGVDPPAQAAAVEAEPDPLDDLPETFTRQALHDGAPADPQSVDDDLEPEPESEPEPEPEPERRLELEPVAAAPEAPLAAVPAQSSSDEFDELIAGFEPASTNGIGRLPTVERELGPIPAGVYGEISRSTTRLVSDAIGLLTEAIVVAASEPVRSVDEAEVARRIDQRFGEYVALLERAEAAERRVKRLVNQNRDLIDFCRRQKALIDQLTSRTSTT